MTNIVTRRIVCKNTASFDNPRAQLVSLAKSCGFSAECDQMVGIPYLQKMLGTGEANVQIIAHIDGDCEPSELPESIGAPMHWFITDERGYLKADGIKSGFAACLSAVISATRS